MRGAETRQADMLAEQRRLSLRRAVRSAASAACCSSRRLFTELLPFVPAVSASPLSLPLTAEYSSGTDARRLPSRGEISRSSAAAWEQDRQREQARAAEEQRQAWSEVQHAADDIESAD